MEENAEGDYEINPQDGMENEVYQEQGEYITEQVYGNENQNEENYDENADNLENYAEFGNSANIIINKKEKLNIKNDKNKNKENISPRPEKEKILIEKNENYNYIRIFPWLKHF